MYYFCWWLRIFVGVWQWMNLPHKLNLHFSHKIPHCSSWLRLHTDLRNLPPPCTSHSIFRPAIFPTPAPKTTPPSQLLISLCLSLGTPWFTRGACRLEASTCQTVPRQLFFGASAFYFMLLVKGSGRVRLGAGLVRIVSGGAGSGGRDGAG